MNKNEKIKLGLINAGVIGFIILGSKLYGDLMYIKGGIDGVIMLEKGFMDDHKKRMSKYRKRYENDEI